MHASVVLVVNFSGCYPRYLFISLSIQNVVLYIFFMIFYFFWQKQDNIPIHLKGGPVDKVLFGSTLVLCAVGLAGCLQFFYRMSFPKKIQD